jgi:hypothetical protein
MSLGRLQWGGILLATLLLVVMAPSDNEKADNKAGRSGNRSDSGASTADTPRSHEAGHVELERLAKLEAQRKDRNKVGDAFNTNIWDEAPAKKPVLLSQPVVPVPPPVVVQTAPPLPFTYLGRYGDTASRTVILSKDDRVYTVSVGDVIDNIYRVERFTRGMVNLTYLPLDIEQHLPTGESL